MMGEVRGRDARTRRAGGLVMALGAAAFGLTGCPGRVELFGEDYEVFGPLTASGRLVWSLGPAKSLVALDPASEAPAARVALPFAPRTVDVAGARVLALGVGASGPVLALIDPAGGVPTQVALPDLFDRVLASPDGAYAVLLYDPRSAPAPGSPAARNANEIAVVDLAAGTATRIALDTESIAPRGVVFSPAGARAAVILDAGVVVLELAEPARRLTVPLVLDGGERLTPEEALFSPDGGHLFIRAVGTADVISVKLEVSGGVLGGSLNFLFAPGAAAVADIAAPEVEGLAGQVAALFTTPAGGSLAALLDPDGDQGASRVVELDVTLRALEDLGGGLFLLHGAGGPGGRAVVGWEPLMDRVDVDQLAGQALAPPTVGGNVAFFRHETGDAGTQALSAASVVREATRLKVKLRPLVLSGVLRSAVADPAGGRVVLGVDVDRAGSGAAPDYDDADDDPQGTTGSLVVLEAETLAIDGLVLDDPVRGLGVVGDHYYAVHPDEFGDVTFVPRATLTREAARRRDGFLLSGLLDAAEEE